MIGHNGDAPGLIATFQRERADIRAIGLIGSSPSGLPLLPDAGAQGRARVHELQGSAQVARRQEGGNAQGQLLRPLLPVRAGQGRHQARGVSQPLDRRHHHQPAHRPDRRRLHLGPAGRRRQHDRGRGNGARRRYRRAMGRARFGHHRLPQGFHRQEPRRGEGLAQGRDRVPDLVLRPAQPRRGARHRAEIRQGLQPQGALVLARRPAARALLRRQRSATKSCSCGTTTSGRCRRAC